MFAFLSNAKSAFRWKISPEVIEHSFTPVVGHQFSPMEFYDALRKGIEPHSVPGLKISQSEMHEGSVLSDKRVYLRIEREKLVFTVCAAPMGENYFFSYRYVDDPSAGGMAAVVVLGFVTLLFWWVLSRAAGGIIGTLLVAALLAAGFAMLRQSGRAAEGDLDAFLAASPIFGPFYERFFRRDTYFRQDSRMMYQFLISGIIKRTIASFTAEKGVRLERELSYAPLLDIYKSNPIVPPVPEAAPDLVS